VSGQTSGEHWWPVVLAVATVATMHAVLPDHFRLDPRWFAPVLLFALVLALVVGDPGRIDRQKTWLRVAIAILIAVVSLANLSAAIRLVSDILNNDKRFANNAAGLLGVGGVIWLTNVIAFAMWYWDLDRGGAAARAHHGGRSPAFVFPEMLHKEYVPPTWMPRFVDYLSLSFWTATAFSPTDVSAIKPWAKLLMAMEAGASLALGALVIARAVNIL
jgi:hypothetical protein